MIPAEEIATKIISNSTNCSAMDMYVRMINEAREEAIEECANTARTKRGNYWDDETEVDKQSILNLIKELK